MRLGAGVQVRGGPRLVLTGRRQSELFTLSKMSSSSSVQLVFLASMLSLFCHLLRHCLLPLFSKRVEMNDHFFVPCFSTRSRSIWSSSSVHLIFFPATPGTILLHRSRPPSGPTPLGNRPPTGVCVCVGWVGGIYPSSRVTRSRPQRQAAPSPLSQAGPNLCPDHPSVTTLLSISRPHDSNSPKVASGGLHSPLLRPLCVVLSVFLSGAPGKNQKGSRSPTETAGGGDFSWTNSA